MKNNWRRAALGLGAAILLAATSAHAQQTLPLVGWYGAVAQPVQAEARAAFLAGMAELGYVEGQNVRYEFRLADGDPTLFGPRAREVAALNPAVIVSSLAACTVPEIREAFVGLPVVVYSIPSASTCIANLAAPEANLTGIRAPNLTNADRVALAKELLPTATRIGFLLDTSGADGGAANRTAVETAAAALGVTVVFGTSVGLDDAVVAFQSLIDQDVDIVTFAGTGTQFTARVTEIMALAATAQMPVVYDRSTVVAQGGLISIGSDVTVIARRAAYYVDRILKGATPGELPVEQADAVVIAVNPAVAASLGITIPESILNRAQVINN